ncbi:uncharacterized protein LOC109541171 isoform X1 [Dendroctonus ponderosae]|uniref:CCDC66 domain-containing protein n=1 Tax=Dendroctonus ponderosae TaxID=77166 RepID=U4UJP5_DENPD|nr:uncharacterized protein LOC109541171 isoform X1 [Dendroctonus ponderosae]ERL94314.1 hypothetical protein D910_11595 [Dendroctonus ponderosae]
MGNIGSQTSQISGNRLEVLRQQPQLLKPYPKVVPPVKVLPDPESRQRLRQTNNGDILQSGGTLSGRHQVPLRNGTSRPHSAAQRFSLQREGNKTTAQSKHYASSQNQLNSQVKSYKSEPDLRNSSNVIHEIKEYRAKKKYKAPAPPNQRKEEKSSSWDDDESGEFTPRRARLFKTRVETKKESSYTNTGIQTAENNSDIIEEKILASHIPTNYARPNRISLPEFGLMESSEFKEELKQVTSKLKEATSVHEPIDGFKLSNEHFKLQSTIEQDAEGDRRLIRGEPSGKESSTPELSPNLRAMDNQKPREFYFGMEREDSDVSSSYQAEEEDDESTIALRLRPVLPRKPPQIPHFSPSAAWRLLNARTQDSGISPEARPPVCSSWTPQQDLEDDSSLEELRRELPKSVHRHRPHIFSLSLPRDLQPASFTTLASNKPGVSSLRKLKRSVSGVLNNLSPRREPEQRTFPKDQDDANWFLSRSAPNSINENSLDIPEVSFSHISTTSRLMYLPENIGDSPQNDSNKYQLSAFSKSCEELKMPESLRDSKSILEPIWSKDAPLRKPRKFTFQSTVRQIERKKMAERLSKEAEKKENQRLRELEAMRRVEEEFQKKRAKEKANIRHQLRLYAMDETQWTSLPFEVNDVKLEERQEPEGALSSSASSPILNPKLQDPGKQSNALEAKKITQVTQELSEYRQIQRDYKEYRGVTKFSTDNRGYRQTTVYPEITCNMPSAKVAGSNFQRGNYRKDFAFGMKSSKSVDSNYSEDSPKYRNKFSPITRF